MTTPALRELMRSYLHQDYDLEGTVEDNVDLFLADDPELAKKLPEEIDAVLAAGPDDSDLERLADALGAEIGPIPPMTYREWLMKIAERVRAN